MSVVVALLLGLGVFLAYDGLTRTRSVSSRPSIGDRGSAWLATTGLANVSLGQFVLASFLAGLGAAAVVLVVIGSLGVALVVALAGFAVPTAFYRSRRRSLRVARRRAWPDAIELLAGAVRAGDTLPAAIGVAAERGPDSLRSVFSAVSSDHRVTGDLVGALERMGHVVADPIADRIVRTLVLAHRVGGRELGRVLRTLSAFLPCWTLRLVVWISVTVRGRRRFFVAPLLRMTGKRRFCHSERSEESLA